MPRDDLLKGRFSESYRAYFVTICTNDRKPWFAEFNNGRMLVMHMRRLHDDHLIESLAWVVMPDHVHWLFQLDDRESLSNVIKLFKGRTAMALNNRLQRRGALWQRGYYDHAVRREEDIKQMARYIVANPLRAGWWNALAITRYGMQSGCRGEFIRPNV